MNQEELLIAAIAIITVVFSCAIIWLQDKLDTARDYMAPLLERRNQDEQLIGTLRKTVATTRKQIEDEKKFAVKLISDHTKETAEAYRHTIELQENNVMLILERNNLQCELDSTSAILDKAKKLLQRGAKGQDTLAALILIEEYKKNN